jgi:hypothetical protein
MTRGSWRFSIWLSGLQIMCFSLLAVINTDDGVAGLWIFSLAALVAAIWFVYLLRVRRNDASFWNEEEARRAEWDRRGRKL